MKMIWAVVRSSTVEPIARAERRRCHGMHCVPRAWLRGGVALYELLIHGGHHKIEAIVEDGQADQAIEKIVEYGSTGVEGDGILSVLDLACVISIRTKQAAASIAR